MPGTGDFGFKDHGAAQVRAGARERAAIRVAGRFQVIARNAAGVELWREDVRNLIVDVGLDDVLDKYFLGSAYTAAHYVGLTDGTPTVAAGDTMASHAGWAEVTAYSEAARPGYSPGAVSGQSVDNSASKATFSIDTDTTVVGGCFLTTDSTKAGTTGTLVAAVAFSADRTLNNGDTLEVTYTFTAADDGV